jgi:hypothetical protein
MASKAKLSSTPDLARLAPALDGFASLAMTEALPTASNFVSALTREGRRGF